MLQFEMIRTALREEQTFINVAASLQQSLRQLQRAFAGIDLSISLPQQAMLNRYGETLAAFAHSINEAGVLLVGAVSDANQVGLAESRRILDRIEAACCSLQDLHAAAITAHRCSAPQLTALGHAGVPTLASANTAQASLPSWQDPGDAGVQTSPPTSPPTLRRDLSPPPVANRPRLQSAGKMIGQAGNRQLLEEAWRCLRAAEAVRQDCLRAAMPGLEQIGFWFEKSAGHIAAAVGDEVVPDFEWNLLCAHAALEEAEFYLSVLPAQAREIAGHAGRARTSLKHLCDALG